MLTGLRLWLFGDHESGVMNPWRLTSFSSCAWHLFRHFRPRSQCMMTVTEHWQRETRLYRYLVCGWSSWLCDISPIAATFSSVYVNFDFQLSTVGHSPWTYPPDISPGRFLSPKTGRYDVPSTLRKLACRTENHTADVSRISNVKPFRVTTEHSENAT